MPHGGMIAAARALFPEAPEPFVDLSTGINPVAYPLGALPAEAFARLPDAADVAALEAVAARAYGAGDPAMVVAAPGAQILIGVLPYLLPMAEVAVVSPTYGEYAACWAGAGHRVTEVPTLDAVGAASCVVVCNPNNPNGRRFDSAALLRVADGLARRGGVLVVDEAFADFEGVSVMPHMPHPGVVVLRSFGKSYGLAGVRLGFAVAEPAIVARLRGALGPWAVSGVAVHVGMRALADGAWRRQTVARLDRDVARLDGLVTSVGFDVIGGTRLFRLYESDRAPAVHEALGRRGILVRRFDGNRRWLRFGLPGGEAEWARLEAIRK